MKTNALEHLNKAMMAYRKISYDLYKDHSEASFEFKFGDWDKDSFYAFRSLFFSLVTGEPDFDKFYDRFCTPGTDKGLKPVAWTTRFVPDLMDYVFWSSKPLDEKVEEIKALYNECKKAENGFKRKKKNDKSRKK
jgi:hypothetical protein